MGSTERDDGVRVEDLFRRAAFNWAISTQRLVEASNALGKSKKVAYTALVDIEHARKLLNNLFVPPVVSTALPAHSGKADLVTAEEVRDSVTGLVDRIIIVSALGVDEVEGKPRARRALDLSAPVYPRGGKVLWAGVDCPVCPSKIAQRCQKPDGAFMEKPHEQRVGAGLSQS